MQFRDATQSDLDYVAANALRGPKEFPTTLDFLYTLEDKGKILGAGGFKLLTPTTAWVWFALTKEALKHKYLVYRVISEYTDLYAKKLGLRRLMAAIEPDFEEGIRTAEHLGYEQESIMLSFFGDKPGLMYVRIVPSKFSYGRNQSKTNDLSLGGPTEGRK